MPVRSEEAQGELEALGRELGSLQQHLHEISVLLTEKYGEENPTVYRAQETECALQRLVWQVERQNSHEQGLSALGAFSAHS